MLHQDLDSGLDEARTHYGAKHNRASALPFPTLVPVLRKPSSAGARPPAARRMS